MSLKNPELFTPISFLWNELFAETTGFLTGPGWWVHSQDRSTSESLNLIFLIFSETPVAIQVKSQLKLWGLCSEDQDLGGVSTMEVLIKLRRVRPIQSQDGCIYFHTYLLSSSSSWFLSLAINKESTQKVQGRGAIFLDHLHKKDLGCDPSTAR